MFLHAARYVPAVPYREVSLSETDFPALDLPLGCLDVRTTLGLTHQVQSAPGSSALRQKRLSVSGPAPSPVNGCWTGPASGGGSPLPSTVNWSGCQHPPPQLGKMHWRSKACSFQAQVQAGEEASTTCPPGERQSVTEAPDSGADRGFSIRVQVRIGDT